MNALKTKIYFLSFLNLTLAKHDFKLLPDMGIAFENTNNIIVTNGLNKVVVSLKLNLPTIERIPENECRANKSDNGFREAVKEAETHFMSQTRNELAPFISDEAEPGQTSKVTDPEVNKVLDAIKQNPKLCGQDSTTCHYHPAMANDRSNPSLFEPKPCPPSNVGLTGRFACNIDGGASICCSKIASENTNKCPDITKAISMINSYQKVFPRKIFVYGQKEYKISELKTYCIGIQTVTIDGKGHNLPVYVDTQVGVRKRHFPQGISRHRPRRSSYRGKRSTWDYITSGWIFSSKYFDDALKHEHDLEASDITLVKDALQKDTKILLSLQADKTEKDNFQKSVCSLTDTISKKIILDELNSAQQTLLLKAESLLRQCSSGLVPDILTNEHLRKLCASVSESEYCLGHEVRALFRCETIQPSISVENVGVNLELELSIPIEEHYESSFIHSIGVPFRSNAIDVQRNVSSLIQKNKPLKSEPEPRSNDINEALKQIFKKLSEKRKKREIVNSYHFLKVKNLPEILVTHERDMLAFDKTDCRYDPRSQFLTCDYSLVKQSEIECIKSMTLGNVNRIEHFCEIDLISSNYPCDNIVVDGIGYLVSTHVDIPIQATSNSKVFISQNVLNTCKRVCAILISGDQKSFSCGNRNFILEPSQTDEVNFAATQIDNIDLRKLGLTRKHDIRQLELSGFDLLDSSLTEHDVSRIATISGTFSLIGMCFVILIFVIRFWSCIYTKAKSCYSRCCKRTVKVEQIPFIGTDRLTRSRKLNSRYTK